MKPVFVLLATLCLGLPSTAAEQRPNIVFVLADDLGIVDINAYATRFTGAGPRAAKELSSSRNAVFWRLFGGDGNAE